MPSPTSRTRPISRATALPLNWSISLRRTETISSALNRMAASLDELFAEYVQAGPHAGVVDPVVYLHHQAAQEFGFDGRVQHGLLAERLTQLTGQALALVVGQGDRRADPH